MKYSQLFIKTRRENPVNEVSINARLLMRGGFIEKLGAGIYVFLPLGWKVHKKIEQIIREEMDAIGGQEVSLSALHPKKFWEKTGRWDTFDTLIKIKDEYALGPTHEEIITPLAISQQPLHLPMYLYQIQVKFRDEERAKSGLLRCREFIMKDLYSFHKSEEDRESYYQKVKGAYEKIFKRCGLDAIYTEASGGAFSERSHEFQVRAEDGEDEIIYCPGGDFAQNVEICQVQEGKQCDLGHGPLKRAKTIEVGNIFPLGTRFSEKFHLRYPDSDGNLKPVIMGSYGIGIGRLMGTIVEVHHDDKGIIWPESVAPYMVHIVGLDLDDKKVADEAEKVYKLLLAEGIETLFDDRHNLSAGEKFADCDLIGIPYRVVISKKTTDKVEVKKRSEKETRFLTFEELIKYIKP